MRFIAILAACAVLVCSGCSGYESSPWGPTQKANPGFRIQANPATGNIDIGCTADMGASAKSLSFEKDGISFEAEEFNVQSNATQVRGADAAQLAATAEIQKVHWAGINGLADRLLAAISLYAGSAGGGAASGTTTPTASNDCAWCGVAEEIASRANIDAGTKRTLLSSVLSRFGITGASATAIINGLVPTSRPVQ